MIDLNECLNGGFLFGELLLKFGEIFKLLNKWFVDWRELFIIGVLQVLAKLPFKGRIVVVDILDLLESVLLYDLFVVTLHSAQAILIILYKIYVTRMPFYFPIT